MEDQAGQISAVAALDEPTRRRLYAHVVRQPEPVSRDEAAAALGIPRTTAAFHLDRLVGEGLLDAVFERRTGRSGPGAGRPAKVYRRSACDVSVTLPDRRYGLAGTLLADAVEESDRTGDRPREVLDRNAYALGVALARTAAGADRDDTRDAAVRVLAAHGYEPRPEGTDITLVNCPFHALAREHTALVCGMNLRLVEGLLDGLGSTDLAAHLRPAPARCCVRLAPRRTGVQDRSTSPA